MELKALGKKVTDFFLKYRFVALILAIGLIFMLVPSGQNKTLDKAALPDKVVTQEVPLEERLSQLLCRIHGAGQVSVLLTKGEGESTVYQTDTDTSTGENSTTQRKTTVTVTDAERNQTGLIQQVNPPKYLGAVVLCQGADDPTVRLSITDAVSKATGLGANRISVLKMK